MLSPGIHRVLKGANWLAFNTLDSSRKRPAATPRHDGGHVAAVIISPKAKQGFQSTTVWLHQSVWRLILEGGGLEPPPRYSTAPGMGES
jgi:hypothetical protein